MDEFFDTQLVSQDAFDCYNSLHNTGRFKTLLDKRVTVQPGPCFMDNTPTPDTVACPGGEQVLLPSQKPQESLSCSQTDMIISNQLNQ